MYEKEYKFCGSKIAGRRKRDRERDFDFGVN